MTCNRTNVFSHDRNSQGEKNGEHNQMIDLPKLLRQLSLARVVLKRLPISTEATKLRITDDLSPVDVDIVDQDIDVHVPLDEPIPTSEHIDNDIESRTDSVAIGDSCDIVDDAEQKFADGSTTTCDRKKPAHLIKRSCPKCKTLVTDVSVCTKRSCANCETPLSYQCARCDKQFNSYQGCCSHISAKCNIENLELKCPKCEYQTHSKIFMSKHVTYCSSRTIYSCSHCEFKTRVKSNLDVHVRIKHEVTDESTATCDRKKSADLIKRSCPKCETLVADTSKKKKRSCANCETPLSYQCARCDKQYSCYDSCLVHLEAKCNAQNLDLKCPGCDYRTHAKFSMDKHLAYCLNVNNFSCDLCEYTSRFRMNLHRHMTIVHKDILKVDCPQCKTKPNKCERCKKKVSICKCCHKGFSSTDSFQEHQKSCKPPVLDCKHCPYQTIHISELRKHTKLEHMDGTMSRALPVKD